MQRSANSSERSRRVCSQLVERWTRTLRFRSGPRLPVFRASPGPIRELNGLRPDHRYPLSRRRAYAARAVCDLSVHAPENSRWMSARIEIVPEIREHMFRFESPLDPNTPITTLPSGRLSDSARVLRGLFAGTIICRAM